MKTRVRQKRTPTQRTERAGEASRVFVRLSEIEEDPLGKALIEQMFCASKAQPNYTWRTAPLVEQSTGLSRIEYKLKSGRYFLDEEGHLRITPDPKDRDILMPHQRPEEE